MKIISSIIPIRTEDFSFYEERLILRATMNLDQVETILVDDGSSKEIQKEIEFFCKKLNFKYVRLETSHIPFSLSRARNAGIDAASCEWIIMEDADIVYQYDFYKKIAIEVELIDESPFNFLTIPVIYLKEGITENIFSQGSIDKFIPKILSRFQFENTRDTETNEVVESFAPASALFIVRKKLLNLVGGYDEYFVGWGGEDRDIAFRMLALNNKAGMTPSDFSITKAWNLNQTYDYEGWRAFYRLTGDYLSNKGIYGFHLYHPKLAWREKTDTRKNIDFAKEKALAFYKNIKIKPRYRKDKPVQIIIGYNPYLINSYVLNSLDNICILDDDKSKSYLSTLEKIQKFPLVDKIVFWNPYGTEWKLNLYYALKKLEFNVIVAERGALPNSYYFDNQGFCIESNSYSDYASVIAKNKDDYSKKISNIKSYIDDLRFGSEALENQNERLPVGLLRLRLGIDETKKILFCPLQLSTDTVTNYYVDVNRTYEDYLNELKKLERILPSDWVLVVKNHPLSSEKFTSSEAIIADNYHINDLLEASASVVLFNSGCGLISMAFEKKVFYYGKCFYAIDRVNKKFETAEQIYQELEFGDLSIDMNEVTKFYYYLLYHFYSFAEVENVVITRGGKKVNQLKSIYYKELRISGEQELYFNKPLPLIPESILLGRYSKSLYLKKTTKIKDPIVKQNVDKAPEVKPKVIKKNVVSPEKSDLDKVVAQSSLSRGWPARLIYSLYRMFVYPFLNSKKKNKFKSKPREFFRDSKSSLTRAIGETIFN